MHRRRFSDDPISDEDEDDLERESYVAYVTEVIRRVREDGPTSTVIGVIGPWGSGKSSVMGLVSRRLARDWEVVEFTPWGYANDDAMATGFLAELHQVLPIRLWVRKRKIIGKAGRAVSPAGALAGLVGVDGRTAIQDLADWIEGDASPSAALRSAKEAARQLKTPVLMVVDDLDRLSPTELLMVFRLVRFVGRLPNVHYLLCYDERTLLDLLMRTDLAATESRARDYLEKMVQVRLDLPPLWEEDAEAMFLRELYSVFAERGIEVDAADRERLNDAYRLTMRHYLTTPRAIVRFVRQLDAFLSALNQEIDPIDFVLVTWVRTFEPAVYELIQKDRENLTSHDLVGDIAVHDENAKARWQSSLKALGGEDRDWFVPAIAAILGIMFIRFDGAWTDSFYSDSVYKNLARSKRIGHQDYFDRYFAFAIPSGDISDADLAAALAPTESGFDQAAMDRLRDLTKVGSARVYRKISQALRDETVRGGEALKFVVAESRVSMTQVGDGGAEGWHPSWLVKEALLATSYEELESALRDACKTRGGIAVVALALSRIKDEVEMDYYPSERSWKRELSLALDVVAQAVERELHGAVGVQKLSREDLALVRIMQWVSPEGSRDFLRRRVLSRDIVTVTAELLPQLPEGSERWVGPAFPEVLDRYFGREWLVTHAENLVSVAFPPSERGPDRLQWRDNAQMRITIAAASLTQAMRQWDVDGGAS